MKAELKRLIALREILIGDCKIFGMSSIAAERIQKLNKEIEELKASYLEKK